MGFHHRTEKNKSIYRIGKSGKDSFKATTEYDLTEKSITPMGGFARYGIVKKDYIMLKGSIPGPPRRIITLRHSLSFHSNNEMSERTRVKFIDTSSKLGHGRFQTSQEKNNMFGLIKT